MSQPVRLNTSFSEFVYTAVRESPIYLQRHLPNKYFRRIRNQQSAKSFSVRATFEEKMEVLSYLGINFYLVFADVNKLQRDDIRKMFSDYNLDDKTGSLKRLADDRVFIASSREFCYNLFHESLLVDTDAYAKAQELVRTSYHVKKWSSKQTSVHLQRTKEEEKSIQKYIQLISGIMRAASFPMAFADVDIPTLTILVYLFQNREYATKEKIESQFGFTPRQVYYSLKKCLEKYYIQRHPADAKKEYMISATGILAVNRFVEKVSNSIDF